MSLENPLPHQKKNGTLYLCWEASIEKKRTLSQVCHLLEIYKR